MNKLDDILDDFGHTVVDNKHVNRTLLKSKPKLEIKILMLKTFRKALEAKSVDEMAEVFREEVKAL